MKTVKSASDLMRNAARHGASVSIGGKVFNAEGSRLAVVPKAPKPVEVEAKPEPSNPALELMAQQIEEQKRLTDVLAVSLKSEPPRPLASWKFSVSYDKDGRITEVIANPVT